MKRAADSLNAIASLAAERGVEFEGEGTSADGGVRRSKARRSPVRDRLA